MLPSSADVAARRLELAHDEAMARIDLAGRTLQFRCGGFAMTVPANLGLSALILGWLLAAMAIVL